MTVSSRTARPLALRINRAGRLAIGAGTLSQYPACPRRFLHSVALHLPDPRPPTQALLDGTAVHAWIGHQHAASGAGCRPDALPRSGPDPTGVLAAESLTGEVVAMLAVHVAACALPPGSTVAIEVPYTVTMPAMGIVIRGVIDDLAYHPTGARRVTERKTTSDANLAWLRRRLDTPGDPIGTGRAWAAAYPQAALGLLLLADDLLERARRDEATVPAGWVASGPAESVIEVLTPGGGHQVILDAGDVDLVAAVRADLTRLLTTIRGDESFAPTPGPACRFCPAAPSGDCPAADTR